jgi:membrane protease YdiL (CAAX protease family)
MHASSFDTRAWEQALGQQVYALALGVLFAYSLEKSRSIVAPMIGHPFSDVVEQLLVFLWIAA